MALTASGTVAGGSTEQWRDRKRYLWLLGLVAPGVAIIAIGGFLLSGTGVFLWAGPIVVLGIIPVVDMMIGLDPSNPPDEVIEELQNDRYYRYVTFAYLPVQYAGFAWAMYLIATQSWPVTDKAGLAITMGFVGGIGINTAHELGHKKERSERWLAKIALAQCFYGHFYVEHNRGHHVRVATPEDPASSRLGESFYRFWPRTVAGSLLSAWRKEAVRYARKGRHPFRPGNNVLNAWAMSLVLWGGLVAWLGAGILPFLLLQAVVAFSLLEAVNYLEHYGMLRQMVGAEDRRRYERVRPSHSWNSNNIATNLLLYHLQRHSDHHANPTRRYQVLRDYKESPALPTGYAGMILLALVPPAWRRVMDRRVVAHFDGDVRLANVQPGKLAALIRKFPPPEAELADEELADLTRRDVGDDVAAARCPGCGYTYDVAAGNESEGFAAGTAWKDIPDDWCCPDCGVREKVDFVPVPYGSAAEPAAAARKAS